MEYLNIRRSAKQLRADGSRYAVPIFVTKSAKFGQRISEKNISVKKSLLLTGEPNSGKSRWITRLHEHAVEIWGSKSKATPLLLNARSVSSSWCEVPALQQWWQQQQKGAGKHKTWAELEVSQRLKTLPDYCADTGAVLFIDDAHKLGGPSLTLALKCVQAARIWVVAAYREDRIAPELLEALAQGKPQHFELNLYPKAGRMEHFRKLSNRPGNQGGG